jgi:hypothetical protein
MMARTSMYRFYLSSITIYLLLYNHPNDLATLFLLRSRLYNISLLNKQQSFHEFQALINDAAI